MVTKSKSKAETGKKKGRVKVDKLKLNKETVKDLTNSEAEKVKGGGGITIKISCYKGPGTICYRQ